MAKRTIKYWLISTQNAENGGGIIIPVELNKLNESIALCKRLNDMCSRKWWHICTNECASVFPELGVKFWNGEFIAI